MKFKKRRFFFEKSCLRAFGDHACHPSTLLDFVNTDLASEDSVETICIISRAAGPIEVSMAR